MIPIQLESRQELVAHLEQHKSLENCVLQSIDLTQDQALLQEASVEGAVFLGCSLAEGCALRISSRGGILFPTLKGVPYDSYRAKLYDAEALFGGFDPTRPESYAHTFDAKVYAHYLKTGKEAQSILETLARTLHDHAMSDALHAFIAGRHIVAIMGGHSVSRTDPIYKSVASLARRLAREGILIATGGGPGAMEAGHLGVYLAAHDDDALDEALEILAQAPLYEPVGDWLAAAFFVRQRFEERGQFQSLGIPTWLYGHEPPTAFASHVAKYFANSIREDGLLAIAKGGIVFSPGSAGTIQEIFQDATQNHYKTTGVVSPMIFFGDDYWQKTKPVYPLLKSLAHGNDYARLLMVSDEEVEVANALLRFRGDPQISF